jgi:predicted N-acetyltransferase YhbS
MSVCVRKAEESDRRAIADVVTAAFGPGEGPEIVQLIADLVADTSAQPVLSLVATTGDRVVGHVLFSRARVETEGRELSATILAPLAVDPEFQSRGIGGQLVMEGLRQLAEVGLDLVFVLGHPDYYPGSVLPRLACGVSMHRIRSRRRTPGPGWSWRSVPGSWGPCRERCAVPMRWMSPGTGGSERRAGQPAAEIHCVCWGSGACVGGQVSYCSIAGFGPPLRRADRRRFLPRCYEARTDPSVPTTVR